jgi:DNA polymerase-3 subunit epsilon
MKDILYLRFAFLDFEASSLGLDSWPVEIGLSWIDQNLEVQTFESLIQPDPEWSEDAWSDVSALVHNIPRRDLDAAPDVQTVAANFLEALDGRIALSDAPPFERHWLDQLFSAASVTDHVSIHDFDAITLAAFSPRALDFLYERLERITAPHRAGADSARFARGWLAGMRREGEI